MMRVIVTGARDWDRPLVISAVLTELLMEGEPLTIVHGASPTGADAVVDKWAKKFDVETETFPASWERDRGRAGDLRNLRMVRAGADLCVAFTRGGNPSRATDCAALAEKAGIKTIRYDRDEVLDVFDELRPPMEYWS